MRRASLPAGLALGLAVLAWLLVPLVRELSEGERALLRAEPGLRALAPLYQDPAVLYFTLPVALLLWSAWRGAPARIAWGAWDLTRPWRSAIWSTLALAASVAIVRGAVIEATYGRVLPVLVALPCVTGVLALRALHITPRVEGFVPARWRVRIGRFVLAFAAPSWILVVSLEESYWGRLPSGSRAQSEQLGLWRADPAWRDTLVPARTGEFAVHDLFVEERSRVVYRGWIVREVVPQGEFDLVAVVARRPPLTDGAALAAVLHRRGAPPDTVILGGIASGEPHPVRFGRIAPPLPDSLRLFAVDETSGRPLHAARRRR